MSEEQEQDSLSEQRRQEYMECFQMFDKDNSGYIEADELRKVMQGLGLNPTKKEVDQMIAEADSHGEKDGRVNFEEFCHLMSARDQGPEAEQEHFREAFQLFDKDNSGTITKTELFEVLTKFGDDKMTVEEAEETIKEFDVDGDGCLNYDEFVLRLQSC